MRAQKALPFSKLRTTSNEQIPPAPKGYTTLYFLDKEIPFLYGAMTLVPARKRAYVQLFSSLMERNKQTGANARYFKYKHPVMIEKNGSWVLLVPK